MIFEAIIIGLIIGTIANGRLHFLTEVEFKGWTLILVGALLQVSPILMTNLTVKHPILQWTPLIGMACIAAAVAINWKLKGFRIILLGALLNIVAMALHSGKMPIHLGMMELAGLKAVADSVRDQFVVNYVGFDQVTDVFKWLGKCIPIPKPYPFPKVLSLGDLLITAGIIRFIYAEMTGFHFKKRGRMVKYSYRP